MSEYEDSSKFHEPFGNLFVFCILYFNVFYINKGHINN